LRTRTGFRSVRKPVLGFSPNHRFNYSEALLNKLSKILKQSPIWFMTILISLVSIIAFTYLPFRLNLFPKTVVRKLYYVDNISDAHLKIIRKFNEKYAGAIEVVPVNLPFNNFTTNDRKEILTRSLRSRSDGIDIFAVDLIWIPRFAKWAYPMDNRFDAQTMTDVNAMALKACYQSDSLVAFPLFLDIGVLYYRKDLIRKLPDGAALEKKIKQSLTWNEFIELGKRFDPAHNPFYVFSGGNFEGLLCCFHEMLSVEESEKIFYNKPINLNTPPVKKALQQLVDLIHRYKISPAEVTRFDEFNSYLYANAHNAVFLRGWVGFHKQYKNFLSDTSNVANMEIAPLPHVEGNTTSSVFGGWSLMVSKFSNRKEEALQFINFMFEKENQEILYDEGGYLPINTGVYTDTTYLKKHQELKQIQEILAWGKHRPSLDNYTQMSAIMSRAFHKALKKEISVDEALVLAGKQVNNEKAVVK
jgi:multiple sugar transport system substrate-binding protein